MKYSEAQLGRIFVIRLEDGDILHESLETFAREQNIHAASITAVGAADDASILITGPKESRPEASIEPMELSLHGAHEITGTGTIFPDKEGNPILHMHIACGRGDATHTGCIRRGVRIWHVMEIILYELLHTHAARLPDRDTAFELLVPEGRQKSDGS